MANVLLKKFIMFISIIIFSLLSIQKVVSMEVQRVFVNDSVKLNNFVKIKPYRMTLQQEVRCLKYLNRFNKVSLK